MPGSGGASALQTALFWYPHAKGQTNLLFCHNEIVVKNTTNIESSLNKKHSSVAYHHCRWSVAAGITTMTHKVRTKILPIVSRNAYHLRRGITFLVLIHNKMMNDDSGYTL